MIPKPADVNLRVPEGFQIEVFAEGFRVPRFMTLTPQGDILVSDSAGKAGLSPEAPYLGNVSVLTGQGQRKALISGLDRPYGLAFWNGYLYVAEPESVKRYKFDATTMSVGNGQEIISLRGLGAFHWTRTLLFDRAGEKLYVSIGSGSNHNVGEDEHRATICRSNPDGSDFEIFASGLRNPVGLRWYPGTDRLWTSVQERDDLGDDLVPDYLTHVQPHGFYGWPYAYIGPHEDPFNSGMKLVEHMVRHPGAIPDAAKISDLVKSTLVPDVLLGSHVGVLDFLFYTGHQFPAEYWGGAFLAFHGSANRSKRVGYAIAFQPFQDGRPSGPLREVVTGWMLSPDSDSVWGRPVGLLQLPDGSLLISDDGGKKIWRLSYGGKKTH
ncbi:MAG TPA: PQQ-dependent sugar dehydrogenase [Bryobacteraceae bacterium]|nr:PQQ-dependent sugar dehydrogenase [Bryobacteraceae bacterium]